MFTLFLKRLIVVGMAFISLFTMNSGKGYSDNYTEYDFPIISAEMQRADTLRVMSFNLRYADVNGTVIYDRITNGLRQIFEIMPDSVGFQEATSIWMVPLTERLIMYDWVGGVDVDSGNDLLQGGSGNPIFYLKAKFKLLDSGYFWLSDTPDVPSYGPGAACRRICVWAKLKNRLTGEVYVHVNTHFDHISEEARVQGGIIVNRYIEEHFSDVPVVFTADMDTTEKREAYPTMTQNLTDTRLIAKDCVAYGTFHGGKDPNAKSDYFIDFVLCSDDFDVCAYRTVTKGVDGRFTSDHFPIYADLKLKQTCLLRGAA